MAKRKKRKYRLKERYTPKTQLKEELRKINWKLIFKLVLSCGIVMAIYQTALYFQFGAIMWIYYGLLIVTVIAFVYFNKGINRKTITREELPLEWSESEKDIYLEKLTKHKNIAKKLLLLIIPLLLTFAFEVIYLFYLDQFIKL
jgi:hypothetical protein